MTFQRAAATIALTGTSPRYSDGRGECVAAAPVVVREGAVTHADVTRVML